ncbi:MFS transporter [Nonomuraea sp. NPDC049607]|uniref:MFS transporter n=1 Tax=Nonomuraea sp. NPDC049607 TaxID=3154732 RepID=UPI003437E60A
MRISITASGTASSIRVSRGLPEAWRAPAFAEDLDGLGAYRWGLSALMLANIIGTVLAGRAADRRGPWRPMALGMLVFAAGCVVAGAAPSWLLFLVGRFGQGLGVGAVMSMAYTMIGLAYPERLRARMYALLSSAWTIPSLVGPPSQASWPTTSRGGRCSCSCCRSPGWPRCSLCPACAACTAQKQPPPPRPRPLRGGSVRWPARSCSPWAPAYCSRHCC